MADLKEMSEQFNLMYDKFMTACDSVEDENAWDKDENGEMESYYTNDLISVVLRLSSIDGEIDSEEVDFINELFGFEYSKDELEEVYELSKDIIADSFASNFVDGVDMLKNIDEDLADTYVQMFDLITEIIAESDGEVSSDEEDIIQQIKSML